jgi:hypothetical protein
MLSVTCGKCGRRFTPATVEIEGYLAQSKGDKYALVLCPHCGKGNKVDVHRLQQALRFVSTADQKAEPANEPSNEEAGR